MGCLKASTENNETCSPYIAEAITELVKEVVDFDKESREPVPLPYTMENIEEYYGNSTCVCDPALAVHCIFDVHHLSKQDDPDWENLCP